MAKDQKSISERLADGWRWIIRQLSIVEEPQQITFGSQWEQDYPTPSPYPVVNSMSAFGGFPWVYAAIEAVANDISGLPINIQRTVGTRSRVVDNHPMQRLLRRPSSQVGPTLWRRQMIVDLLLCGNFYGLVIGRGASVTSIIRLHPEHVQIIPSVNGGILAYRFTDGEVETDYSPDDVIHIRQTSWRDGPASLYGQGAIEVLKTELAGEYAASQRWRNEAGRGQPSMTISPKGDMPIPGDVMQKLVKAVQKNIEASGVVPINGPVDVNLLPFNARDMEFSSARDWTRASVLAVIGVAYVRLFLPSANFATAKEQNRIYWQNLLGLISLVEDGLTRIAQRMGTTSDRVVHDTSAVDALQESRTDRMTRAAMLVETFGLSPMDALKVEGFNEIDPSMLQPASQPAEAEAPVGEPMASAEDQLLSAQRAEILVGAGVLSPNEARDELGYTPIPQGDEIRPALRLVRAFSDLSESVQEGLRNKADEHNKAMEGKAEWRRTTPATLGVVFQRGVGAYNENPASVRPGVGSSDQWAYARVNSFLYALRNDRFRSGKHDTDLLPEQHPQSSKGDKAADQKAIPEKYSHIDFAPTAGMIAEAKRAVEWIEQGEAGDGMVQSTKVWARKVANGDDITPEKARLMRAWLARHEVDKQGEGFNVGEAGYPSAGRVAWAAWFGDPGQSWSNKVVRQMEAADEAEKSSPQYAAKTGDDMTQRLGIVLKRIHNDEEPDEMIQSRFKFIASTSDVDRMGDIVEQSWNLESFKQNPVILWNHDSSKPPIARATSVQVEDGQLQIEMEFDMQDPFAAEVAGKLQRGFLSAGSVGFFPGEVKYRADLPKDDPRYKENSLGIVASQNELVEFSITPVPANSNALLAASADQTTDEQLRNLLADPATRRRIHAMIGNAKSSAKSDELSWLRDQPTAAELGLPFLKESD
jgi:HK97 family phage portal protein/HK97 family phage prohead protease